MFKKRKESENHIAKEDGSDKDQIKIQFFIRESTSKSISKTLMNLQKDIQDFLSFYPEIEVNDIKFNVAYKNNDMEVACIGLLIYK